MDGDTSTALLVMEQTAGMEVGPSTSSLWDSAAFLQTERVAGVMADSGLMPKALTHIKTGQGNNAQEVELAPNIIFARAVLIATQARSLDVDPVLFAQCCAIVHGRLMYEGKLVAAMMDKRLGLTLDYEFGLWDTDHFVSVTTEEQLHGAQDRLSVRVSAKDREGRAVVNLKGEPKTVAGSVAVWKTAQWGGPATYRQRLIYRGAREWARAHSPGIMLGIVTTDEAEELETHNTTARGAISAPTPQLHSDFEDIPQDPTPQPPKERGGKRRAVTEKAADALQGDDIPDALKEPAQERPTTAEGPVAGDGAPAAEPEQASPASATPASDATAEQPEASTEPPLEAGPVQTDEPIPPPLFPGHAEPGEVYLHHEFGPTEDGRRVTFKDGTRFSSVGAEGAAKLKLYGEHSPEIAEEEEECDHEFTDGAGGELACKHCGALPDPDPVDRYIDEVEAATTWAAIRAAMGWFFPSADFTELAADEQASFRVKTWEFASKLSDVDDHAASPTAFRLWIEACDDPAAISFTLGVLEKAPAFDKMQPSQKDGLRRAAAARIEALKG